MVDLNSAIVKVATLVVMTACASSCIQETSEITDPEVLTRVSQLRAEVESAEDLSEVKRLQKAYGYYLDKGMWTDLVALFAEDATLTLPIGIYEGKESIARHFYLNVGKGELNESGGLGEDGLREGVLNNHIIMQPVVHVDMNNTTARGRWRVMAMKADLSVGSSGWAEGVYNVLYTQSEGVWRIQSLEYFEGYENSYAEGWGVIDADSGNESRVSDSSLFHAADRINDNACHYSDACIAPFNYQNLGTTDDANSWRSERIVRHVSQIEQDALADLLHRAQMLKDEVELENLQRIFSFYLDRALWDQVTDLFTDEGSIEFGQMGVYQGKPAVRSFLNRFGDQGLVNGWLFDHVQLQTIVSVDASGLTAKVRSREWGMIGYYGQEGSGRWHDGVYENSFVKEGGVWKVKSMHYYPSFVAEYSSGWLEGAISLEELNVSIGEEGISDGPKAPTERYGTFPETYIPAFHYANPVTAEEPSYPDVGRPSDDGIRINRLIESTFSVDSIQGKNVEDALNSVESLVQQVKDHHELENLENAYGYYLDKNLWNDLADLFAVDGSMELAQRGAYVGRERVRGFLFNVFGDEGPVEGRLGNHLHMQPVIHVSEDGQRANIRSRMMQQLNFTGNPSMGAAIYINEAVKEEGRWKFASTHAFNTFTATYFGGWVENPGTRLPGMSESYPPDLPPTVEFSMFPDVYEIPFHYDNPVSGRH